MASVSRQPNASGTPTTRDEADSQTPHGGHRACILVVDDDPTVLRALKSGLERAGHRVLTASDGTEAVTRFAEEDVDLAILDVELPDFDGFDVCASIKADKNVPILFLTGSEDPIVKDYLPQMADAVGGNLSVRKPVDVGVVVEMVDQMIRAS